MEAQTITLLPYDELRITGGESVAYLNGGAPHLVLRDGSDAYRLPQGQCVPMRSQSGRIVNPYPRAVECLIGRGLPVRYGPETASLSYQQKVSMTVQSNRYKSAATQTPGTRMAFGLLMNKGRAIVRFNNNLPGLEDTKLLIFRGASQAFLYAKPAGCMDAGAVMRFKDLTADDSVTAIYGEYTPQHIVDWMGAAGYNPANVIEYTHINDMEAMVTETDAVFLARYNTTGFHAHIEMTHLGADLGDFD